MVSTIEMMLRRTPAEMLTGRNFSMAPWSTYPSKAEEYHGDTAMVLPGDKWAQLFKWATRGNQPGRGLTKTAQNGKSAGDCKLSDMCVFNIFA